MIRLILEVTHPDDLAMLLPLLERLNIRVLENQESSTPISPSPEREAFILQGLPDSADLNRLLQDFETSRKDRPL